MKTYPMAYSGLSPDGQAYAEALLKDESPPCGSYNLYRALLIDTQGTTYSRPSPWWLPLLEECTGRWRLAQRPIAGSHLDGQAYVETLLKDKSPPCGSYSYHALVLMAPRGIAIAGPRPDSYPFSGPLQIDWDSPNGL